MKMLRLDNCRVKIDFPFVLFDNTPISIGKLVLLIRESNEGYNLKIDKQKVRISNNKIDEEIPIGTVLILNADGHIIFSNAKEFDNKYKVITNPKNKDD